MSDRSSPASQPPAPESGFKAVLKTLATRAMRPGLQETTVQLDRLADRLDRVEQALAVHERDQVKYDAELEYWRYLVKRGGAQKDFGEPFETVFGRWQRERIVKLGVFLGLPTLDLTSSPPGGIDDWCAARSVIEIGAGPYPAIAAAKKGWKRGVAVDPIARGYVEEGLTPAAADRLIYIEAPGERIPLPNGFADLVICENCLDHVTDPQVVVDEIERLLTPGGLLWLFVDLSSHQDHMHPHPMNEDRVKTLLSRFEFLRVEATNHKAHPEAYGSLRALCRRPANGAAAHRNQALEELKVARTAPRTPHAANGETISQVSAPLNGVHP